MTKEQKQVIEFMTLFHQHVLDQPIIPSLEVRRLRAKLILEEAIETVEALGFDVLVCLEVRQGRTQGTEVGTIGTDMDGVFLLPNGKENIIKIADGLADLHYVGYCGTAAACGIDMEPVFAEVHRSNMSKMWTEEDLKQQKTLYPTGVVENYGGGLYRILVDGKVIKSPSYSPADIASILAQQ